MNVKRTSIFLMLALLLALVTCGCIGQKEDLQATQSLPGTGKVQITDMLGRELTVPANITKVITTAPPSTMLVYMIAPEKLAAWNFVNKFNSTFIDEKYLGLPEIGSWAGQQGNYETFSNIHPDIIIEAYTTDKLSDERINVIERRQKMFGNIPVVGVDDAIVFVEKADPSIEYVGELLGVQDRAKELIKFKNSVSDTINSKISTIPEEKRVRVYYAEGPKGLATDPTGSMHSQIIELAGGVNVADCPLTPGVGLTPVSIEQIMRWKPDAIITNNRQFYSTVYSDSLWANLDAVKNKRVYLAPDNPYCWIDRPPGPHLFMGRAWAAKNLYPEQFADMDLEKLTRDFYAEFFHYKLTDEELRSLLYP